MYNKNKKGFSDSRKYLLGGGNSNIFRFHPEPWGKMNPFWLSQIFDQLGGNQPPPDGWTCAFWPEAACGNLKSFSQVPKKKNIYLNWQLLKKFVSGHHFQPFFFFLCVVCVTQRRPGMWRDDGGVQWHSLCMLLHRTDLWQHLCCA